MARCVLDTNAKLDLNHASCPEALRYRTGRGGGCFPPLPLEGRGPALLRPHCLNLLNTGESYEQQQPVKVPCRRSTPPQGRVTQGPLTMGACVRSPEVPLSLLKRTPGGRFKGPFSET